MKIIYPEGTPPWLYFGCGPHEKGHYLLSHGQAEPSASRTVMQQMIVAFEFLL